MARSANLVDLYVLRYERKIVMGFDTLEDAQHFAQTNNPFGWYSHDDTLWQFGQQQSGDLTKYTIEKTTRFVWNEEKECHSTPNSVPLE